MSGVLQLGWGPGPGDRMLAPGLPDVLITDGAHLGWLTREGAWALMEDEVNLVCVPHPTALSVSPGCWMLLHGSPGDWVLTRFNPREPEPRQWHFESRGVEAGSKWVVLDQGAQRQVQTLEGGEDVFIPAGAADARPRPWSDGPGLIWLAQETVYRMAEDLRVRVAGPLPRRPDEWRCGPAGSAVFRLDQEVWAMSPTTGPRLLSGLAWEDLRFSPSGDRVLGATLKGVEERCLRSGQVLWSTQGQLIPVGFAPAPVMLEERTGRVRDAEGHLLARGFSPSAAVQDGQFLYGPGGTAWDLESGVQRWPHSPLYAEHLTVVGDLIVAITDEMHLFDRDGEPCGHRPLPLDQETEGPIVDLAPTDTGTLLVYLEDGAFELTLDGQRKPGMRPLPQAQPQTTDAVSIVQNPPALTLHGKSTKTWPLATDGAALVGGRLWCWTEDGMLCGLEPEP